MVGKNAASRDAYVVFEFNHIAFPCYHKNNTQITRMSLVSLIYITTKITPTPTLKFTLECYEKLNSRFALEHRDLTTSETDSLVKDLFLFHPVTNARTLYKFEKICACVDDNSCRSIADTTPLQDAIDAACASTEADRIRSKQEEVSENAFAPIGDTVASTWIKMLAKNGKCKWKEQDVPTNLDGMTSCPDARTIATVFPELTQAGGHIKAFNDLFNPFLMKFVPAIMKAALKDYPELKVIFQSPREGKE